MAYKLELPTSSRVHLLFHVSFLKKVIGNKIPIQTILLKLGEEGKFILELEKMSETRTKKLQNRVITEYLVKWKNLPVEDLTWEYESLIQKHPQVTSC